MCCAVIGLSGMRERIAVGLVAAVLSGSASAGAWGSGAFDNDDALDFVAELARQRDAALVYRTLQAVRSRTGYLQGPEGSAAVAAAEVVAALNGHPCKGMPETLERWIQGQKSPTKDQVSLAIEAMRRVRGPRSELSDLWADAGPADRQKWEAAMQDLVGRLQKPPAEKTAPPPGGGS